MSYTSTGGLPTIPRLAVAGVDEGAPDTTVTSGSPASLTSLTLPTQAVAPAVPASGVVLYANSSGRLSWRSASDTYSRSIIVTATANRTFTAPDADFTFAGQNLANTFTLANTFSANGALSAPAFSLTGTPITGGSSTTTKPLALIETSGATSTAWSTAGTMLGVNALASFSGRLIDAQLDGVSKFSVTTSGTTTTAGNIILASASIISFNSDATISRKAAANLQLGAADAASPVAQTLSVQSVVAGTTDTAGANWTLNGSRGTGTGAGGSIVFQVATAGSTGSSQNTLNSIFRIVPAATAGGYCQFGGTAAGYAYPFTGTSPSTIVGTGTGLGFWSLQNSSPDEISFNFGGTSKSSTSGTVTHVSLIRSFAPTSGTGVYNHFLLQPTINQTGGANGITRGLYINPTLTAAADFRALEISAGNVVLPKTVTAAGTTGKQTIDKVTGSVNFAEAATSLVVTDAYVTANSIIVATVASNDTTMKSVAVVAGSGSFTIYPNAAPTAETRVNFIITN